MPASPYMMAPWRKAARTCSDSDPAWKSLQAGPECFVGRGFVRSRAWVDSDSAPVLTEAGLCSASVMRAGALVAVQIDGEFRRRVGVSRAPGLVVDDPALEAIVGVYVGDELVERLELLFRIAVFAAHVDQLDPGRLPQFVGGRGVLLLRRRPAGFRRSLGIFFGKSIAYRFEVPFVLGVRLRLIA